MLRNIFLILGIGLLLGFGLTVSVGANDTALDRVGLALTTLDSLGKSGQYTSVTVGADGLDLISYHDVTNRTLKVVHCSDPSCIPTGTKPLSITGSHRSENRVPGWLSVGKKKKSATAERERLRAGSY